MKILLITQQFPYGSGEQFLETEIPVLANEFEEIHIVPFVADLGDERKEVPSNVIVNEDIPCITRLNRSTSIITDLVEKNYNLNSFNILYSYWLIESALVLGVLKKKYPHLYALSRGHGYDVFSERHNLEHLPYQLKAIEGLDAVFTCCKYGADYLSKKFPAFSKKITHKYLGVAAQNFTTGSDDNVLRIVSCATLKPLKRIHFIAEALGRVTREIEWTHLGDGEDLEKIKSIASDLPDNIKCYFPGNIINKDVINYYQANPVDAFVNVSETEALPVSIMEAMSFGIPCVATDVGGVSEIVNEENGWLLEKDFSLSSLSELFENFNLNNEKRRKLAYEKQRTLFDAEANYKDFARLLKAKCNVMVV